MEKKTNELIKKSRYMQMGKRGMRDPLKILRKRGIYIYIYIYIIVKIFLSCFPKPPWSLGFTTFFFKLGVFFDTRLTKKPYNCHEHKRTPDFRWCFSAKKRRPAQLRLHTLAYQLQQYALSIMSLAHPKKNDLVETRKLSMKQGSL